MPDLRTRAEIESRALRIVERAKQGLPLEDSSVELKREWINPVKAARRLAGHANAARGESIMWIIGVDEGSRSVVNPEVVELASWWQSVQSCFESVSPPMLDLIVHPTPQEVVVALQFETTAAPYLVKNPEGGKINYEVPWRDATGTRTARRSDLLMILAPLARTPEVEVVKGTLSASWRNGDPDVQSWRLTLGLYVVPETRVVIPYHRSRIQAELSPGHSFPIENVEFTLPPSLVQQLMGTPPERSGDMMRPSHTQLVVEGPGRVDLIAHSRTDPYPLASDMKPRVEGEISFSPGTSKWSFSLIFERLFESEHRHWKWSL